MTATETTRVEIDDAIRANPDLLRAVNEATAYVLEKAEGVAPPGLIQWRIARHEPENVELRMTEAPEFGGTVATHTFPARYLNDPFGRNTSATRPFADLLRKRSVANLARIDELIRGFDFEAFAHAYSDALKRTGPHPPTPQE